MAGHLLGCSCADCELANMIVTRSESFDEVLLNEMTEEVLDTTRTHPSVTDLIYCLTKNWMNSKRSTPQEFSRQTKMYFAIGLGLEANMLKRRKENATAGVYDGISYHADSLDDVMVEFKTTRANPKGYPDAIPLHHLKQILSYMKPTGFRKCYYSVLFLIQGELMTWELEFTDQEVEANWEWMRLRKEVWEQADAESQAPESYVYNMDWECKNCDFAMLCQVRNSLKERN